MTQRKPSALFSTCFVFAALAAAGCAEQADEIALESPELLEPTVICPQAACPDASGCGCDSGPTRYRGDLVAGWVTRLPRLDYVWGSANPTVEGWPSVGQLITWRGNVRNRSNVTARNVLYQWLQDGAVIASGTVTIGPGATASVDLPWTWTFARRRIELAVDPGNAVVETEERNNRVGFDSDAISVGLYVERSVYNYFDAHQRELGVGSNSWEDWAKRHVAMWNDMFAASVYPEAPSGVIERIRLDQITVVNDGALPLAGGLATNDPNLNDRSVDLQWGFPASLLSTGFYNNTTSATTDNPFYYEASLLHELGHARYLVDVYGFNVHEDGSGATVGILEGGAPVAGSVHMPLLPPFNDAVYHTKFEGLMNSNGPLVDRHSAPALNRIKGRRAVLGNYNAPGNIGEYLNDLPAQNRLTVKDASGNALAGARVDVYRAGPRAGVWYGKHYDNTPDMTITASSEGRVLLGRCPFSASGTVQHTFGVADGVLIVRVEHGGKRGYGFLEIADFNLEYWRGHTGQGEHELRVTLR
ncbi:CARDB domain-containing protein [Sorangium sp. So ce861]|uniref:CARDB domain-containing protein n=1 Tax=Sorangium sp. So ce861 TaxID=3133323 RepID=UPI003F62BB66